MSAGKDTGALTRSGQGSASAFLALCFDAPAGDAERWSDALLEAGALSVDVSDPFAGTVDEDALFDEPQAAGPRLWELSRLQALFRDDVDLAAVTATVSQSAGEPLPPHNLERIEDADWVRTTQAQFQPLRVDPRLWIVPSWCEPPDPAAINLRLDPGLAFGTGSHPSTRLCLRWMSQNLRMGDSVIDYGCGSGVLAIAAKKLGAGRVTGIDIDPQALEASRANAARNDVEVEFADTAAPLAPADALIANILAGPLQLLAPNFARCVHDAGSIVLSGVLMQQESAVGAAYAPWFTLDVWGSEDGWVALAGKRRSK